MPEMPKDFRGAPLKNLTVFVLPHSHDDTGWQRTVDQYYEEEVRFKCTHVLLRCPCFFFLVDTLAINRTFSVAKS